MLSPISGQYQFAMALKTSHDTSPSSAPGTTMSRMLKCPEEYAMALAGVPIGSVVASPAGTAITSAMMRGSIPNSPAMPRLTGINSATTAELLIASVNKMARKDTINTTVVPPVAQRVIVACASQAAAPDLLMAAPRQMAPPYIRITPQLTYRSTSPQLTRRSANSTTTAPKAILARPNSSPPITHALKVTAMTKAMARSL